MTELGWCNIVMVHSISYEQQQYHVLKHYIYMYYKCRKQSISSTMRSWHHLDLTVTKSCQNLTYNMLRVD
jgi:hypothetical protein